MTGQQGHLFGQLDIYDGIAAAEDTSAAAAMPGDRTAASVAEGIAKIKAMDAGKRAVEEWSLRIHGAKSDRHLWALAAADALAAGTDVPPFPIHKNHPDPLITETRANTVWRVYTGRYRAVLTVELRHATAQLEQAPDPAAVLF